MIMKRWTPLFDPRIERYESMPIWVNPSNLPFKYWSVEFFKLIGNTLGTYLEEDLSFVESGFFFLGKVLVLLNLRYGLAADILIKRGDFEFSHPLDYKGIRFKCKRCHVYVHVVSECSLSFS